MLDQALEFWQWLLTHPNVIWWSGLLSVVMFLGTLIVVPVLLVRIPTDYFISPPGTDSTALRQRSLPLWAAFHVAKNLLGLLLLVMGIVLLALPGQGLLTILLGLSMLDLPGKRRLEIALLRQPSVSRAVTWLRRKSLRPPLKLPPKYESTESN